MTEPQGAMQSLAAYPTIQHARAAERITDFFAGRRGVEAVLLTCSCARGKAVQDSCLDIAILVDPVLDEKERAVLKEIWEAEHQANPLYRELEQVGLYSQVDLEWVDGVFNSSQHGYTSGADPFELEIGNLVAYVQPLWSGGRLFAELQARWLPYYGDALREERLRMVSWYFDNNLRHIPPYLERGLYFQVFQRLYHAISEFQQALYIHKRVYPIAYDKWVREGLVELLHEPEVYRRLVGMMEIHDFESDEMGIKAQQLRALYEQHIGLTQYLS